MQHSTIRGAEPAGELRRGFRILGIDYGLASSSGVMLDNQAYFIPGEIFSQLSNWDELESIPYREGMDSYLYLEDSPRSSPSIRFDSSSLYIRANLKALENEIQDRRWAILGNQGIWFRHALATQERRGILSFHAASIYDPENNQLAILLGKAGAGKSVYLLSALLAGWKVFSTEMTYLRIEQERLTLYRGSLSDNILIGSLTQDFPEALSMLDLDLPEFSDPWEKKISVGMHTMAVESKQLINPTLILLFPHIERGQANVVIREIQAKSLIRRLFENASEKIGASMLLHEQLPAIGMDTAELTSARLAGVRRLIQADPWEIRSTRVVSSGLKNCMEGLKL
jgi:hypothetical protein